MTHAPIWQAMGWLALFLPTNQAAREPGALNWNACVGTILEVWEVVAPCDWFHMQALGLLTRLAKHDKLGAPDLSLSLCVFPLAKRGSHCSVLIVLACGCPWLPL